MHAHIPVSGMHACLRMNMQQALSRVCSHCVHSLILTLSRASQSLERTMIMQLNVETFTSGPEAEAAGVPKDRQGKALGILGEALGRQGTDCSSTLRWVHQSIPSARQITSMLHGEAYHVRLTGSRCMAKVLDHRHMHPALHLLLRAPTWAVVAHQ